MAGAVLGVALADMAYLILMAWNFMVFLALFAEVPYPAGLVLTGFWLVLGNIPGALVARAIVLSRCRASGLLGP
jgi:hypothetical protein